MDYKELIKRIYDACIVGKTGHSGGADYLGRGGGTATCNGEIVRIGELGSLSLSVSSKGCQRQEDFSSKQITKVRTIFRERRALKFEIAQMRFKKVVQRNNPMIGFNQHGVVCF